MTVNFGPYFKILRIKNWAGRLVIAFFGFVISKGYAASLPDIVLFGAILFLFLGFGFSINDCFDTEEDKYDKNKNKLIVGKEISFRNSLFFSISLALLGVTLSAFLGIKVFLFCLILFSIIFFYSAPPLRFKSKPFLDLISHGLFFGALIFFLPLFVFKIQLSLFHYLLAFSFFYFSIILELRNHLDDYGADKKAGLKTTVCLLGCKNSEKILKYLVIFYPLSIFPVYLLFFNQYLILFFILTIIFLVCFLFGIRWAKIYYILDVYFIFSVFLISLADVISSKNRLFF